MSNETSASETTPLRRPEDNYRNTSSTSSSVSSSSLLSPSTFSVSNRNSLTRTASNDTGNASTRHLLPRDNRDKSPSPLTAFNTVVIANRNNNNCNSNNSNTEVCLSGTNTAASQSRRIYRSSLPRLYSGEIDRRSSSAPFTIAMDTNKRILYRVGLDVLILLCVGFPILCFYLWGDSYKRGFFCDDESLMHPFKESTVKNWMLYFIGLVIPIGVIFIVEIIKFRHKEKATNGNSPGRRYVFMDYEIPEWLVECYKKIGIFAFGAAVGQLTTDIAKYSIGRLRPHFFAVCQPVMPDGTTCRDPINQGRYIQDFHCAGVGSSHRMIKESTLSFPSGHSSFTFFTMVYLALYLQSRMTWHGSKLLRHFLQFVFIMIAWYTALSRVSDYKHHWSDVLSGSLIGALTAVVVANYVSDLFQHKSSKAYILPRSMQDVAPQTLTANGN